ncbi:hypothetical protein AYO44_06530 [Planctomycetaceae bacterium SCGC AG-212-F19]|nr:hypothetical protein AYO44_06530 [Planctomycetaceae bacterium SCGC AG-212-F19]
MRIMGCHTNTSDAELAKLQPQLRHLFILDCTKITDAGLAHLKDKTNLEFLFINRSPITDKGLAELHSLPKLRKLYLRYCNGVTEEGIEALQVKLPDCKVIRDRFPKKDD